jgi:thiol-disulfide isomerase/thioredoxin
VWSPGLLIGWFCAGLCAGCDARGSAPRPAPSASLPPQAAPDNVEQNTELTNVDANRVLARSHGAHTRGLVVNMWASWCGSCREEIPLLLGLQQAFAAEGIEFMFVSADERKDQARALALAKEWGAPLPLPVVNGSFGEFKRGLHPKWRGAIPATFLFDTQAKLRYFWEGPILEHEIAPVLQGFLAGRNIDGELRTSAEPR